MNRDFTLEIYTALLNVALKDDFIIFSLKEYFEKKFNDNKYIILRHDVDKNPEQSLKTAIIENKLDIKSSYYFRIGSNSNNPDIIKKIVSLGHEIGYHYEDLAAQKGEYDKAIDSFGKNLEYFRKYYPVKTICMHGSPLSKWDNRLIWDKIDYKDYGIIGEPYIDLDYDQICYITDTGRKWNSKTGNIRDKVESAQRLKITSTFDLIREIKAGTIPNKIMINSHPQRWHNSFGLWLSEYILQNSKNVVKKLLTNYNK